MQSANGPCPLLAACNVLLLRNQLPLPSGISSIGFDELIQLLSNLLLDLNSRERDAARAANIENSLESTIDVLPTLNVGLDINCKFSGPRDFAYTRELCVFDLLDISVVHGWVVPPEDADALRVIGPLSYNALIERLAEYQDMQSGTNARNDQLLKEGAIIDSFFKSTASQLTFEGLIGLHKTLRERELAVFFRNNHFGTLLRHRDSLYLLCTDVGFLEGSAVWECLDAVDGDTSYLDADFRPPKSGPSPASAPAATSVAPPGSIRATCPQCKTLNEFRLGAGGPVNVQCGVCRCQFPAQASQRQSKLHQMPHGMGTKKCQTCGVVNSFPSAPGAPVPRIKCGACGTIN